MLVQLRKAPVVIEWKRCGKCGETKPLSGFHNDPRQKDGHHPNCKVCVNAYWRERRAKRKENRRGPISLKHYLTEKKCAGCNETKEVAEFYRDRGHRGGLDRLCKACRKSRSNAQRARDLHALDDGTDALAELLDDQPPAPSGVVVVPGTYQERFVDDNAPVNLDRKEKD